MSTPITHVFWWPPSAPVRSTRTTTTSGEGTFDEYPPPMVETGSKNYLKISLEEIAAGKLKYRYRT